MNSNRVSFFAVFFILAVLTCIRIFYADNALHTLEWDSLGYYIYLPSHYIYHDMAYLKFWPVVLAKYHFPGSLYQASLQSNGKYVFFYEIGMSYLQTPFFFAGHWAAGIMGYPQDGFSAPYQIAICIGTLAYVCIGLFVLRKILLFYFNDIIVAWSLLLITLTTNFLQYASVDAGMTHAYLFTLLCFLLLFTIQWHTNPTFFKAVLIGFMIGLIAAVRITDAVMLFIPLLWNTQTKELRAAKWNFIKRHPSHSVTFVVAVAIPVIPQLIYWKYVSGEWIHQLGSKWEFLTPHLKVLFGWENGWFIYTPVTILMVLGLFFLKKKEYKRSVIVYFLLNLWIITAWHEWRYGAPYSTRALMQSFAIMSIPLAELLQKISKTAWQKTGLIILSAYLCFVNFFQVWQFNKRFITFDIMNRRYYSTIYLNPAPTPVDMSMIDTDERLENENKHHVLKMYRTDSTYTFNGFNDSVICLFNDKLSALTDGNKIKWIKLSVSVKSDWGAFDSYLVTQLFNDTAIKQRSVRLQNGICNYTGWNNIEYYFKIPAATSKPVLKIFCKTSAKENLWVKDFKLTFFD